MCCTHGTLPFPPHSVHGGFFMRSLNPDELIRRWQLRLEAPTAKLVAIPHPIVWEIPENPALPDEEDPSVLIIRPWGGDLYLSLGTRRSAAITLARRPTFAPEVSDGSADR